MHINQCLYKLCKESIHSLAFHRYAGSAFGCYIKYQQSTIVFGSNVAKGKSFMGVKNFERNSTYNCGQT